MECPKCGGWGYDRRSERNETCEACKGTGNVEKGTVTPVPKPSKRPGIQSNGRKYLVVVLNDRERWSSSGYLVSLTEKRFTELLEGANLDRIIDFDDPEVVQPIGIIGPKE